MTDFHLIFFLTIETYLGIDIPFSIFGGPCVFATSRNNGWMDICEIGYGNKDQQATLFHAWIDYATLFKLGATEVCALGVLLVINVFIEIWLKIVIALGHILGHTIAKMQVRVNVIKVLL